MKEYCVYILASSPKGTLYIGVTNDIDRRMAEHRESINDGFTKKYGIHMLVHIEMFSDIYGAITREKQLKKWNRQWKINLIEKSNPEWRDLSKPERRRSAFFIASEDGFPTEPALDPIGGGNDKDGFPPSRE